MVTVKPEDPGSPDAAILLDELSAALEAITGSSGRASFSMGDVRLPRSAFVVARGPKGEPLGCGALRPLDDETAEIKRVYARTRGQGVGSAILHCLEGLAVGFGYRTIMLEAKRANANAVAFYLSKGYAVTANYGRYTGNPEAVCFRKDL